MNKAVLNWITPLIPKGYRMRVKWVRYSRMHEYTIEKERNIYVLVWKGNPRNCAINKAKYLYNNDCVTAWHNPIEFKECFRKWWSQLNIFI